MSDAASTETAGIPLVDQVRNDVLCDQFEAAWRGGEQPDLSGCLDGITGPARVALFRELLALELEFRLAAGASLDAEVYRARFPGLPGVIDAAFAQIASRSNATRTRVRTPDDTRTENDPGWVEPGNHVTGALRAVGYEIERELGRGGMGVVYQAYQVALDRNVALKVIKSGGFATEGECLRFQNEAEAVAQLDHPHIVSVFEVGESRGLNYFSMKLIVGTSLDKRRGDFSRDVCGAARLVSIVAEAIHHAHQRGILHRDLKPANILIDERGQPHVTDFGLARRIEGDGELTQSGAIVGTPSYMSPEQATGVKGSLTTATDVYGLGAILYALLTGQAPHAGGSYIEVLDHVRETAPEPPSKCNPQVPRDLEVVCLKCLEKDPIRRYPSARALAEDLTRWLAGEPITARPVGAATRVKMWCRRHPLPAALAALLVLSVAAGFTGVTWKWREAVQERLNSAASVDFLSRMIAESSTDVNPLGERFTVLQMLDRAAARIGGDFQGQSKVEAVIREQVGRAYLSLGRFAEAEPQLRAALALDNDVLGRENPTTLGVANVLAAVLEGSNRVGSAETLLRNNLAVCCRALGPDAEVTLDAENRLGVLLRKSQQLDESEALLRRSLAGRRRVLRAGHPDTLHSVRDLSLLCMDRARFSEADALADEYERGIRCARGPKHPDNVSALANRGLIQLLRGRPAEAEPFYRQALNEARRILGSEHPSTVAAESEHARVLQQLDRRDDRGHRPAAPSSSY